MITCPCCGSRVQAIDESFRAGSSLSADMVISRIKSTFDMSLVNTNACKRMSPKQIAAMIAVSPDQAACTMIGIAAKQLGARSGRSATHRWIEMPPLASRDFEPEPENFFEYD